VGAHAVALADALGRPWAKLTDMGRRGHDWMAHDYSWGGR